MPSEMSQVLGDYSMHVVVVFAIFICNWRWWLGKGDGGDKLYMCIRCLVNYTVIICCKSHTVFFNVPVFMELIAHHP